ncbi:hypothetical protein ASPCAL02797 [Aspergillus calidoustus]|uniref:Alpha/beta hydrolase fold-3 domain-containing protein n=1 Tax=Aspergillus calidoustus TaxID=454130 RepID=A0A0U5CNC6_ASPCI|nr:hypothetical protein ASPCAL02797 [Aspergillus calidoustus]
MADSSLYSTAPSAEWLLYEKTWKRPAASSTDTLKEARDKANARTAKLFADVLGRPDVGLQVTDLKNSKTNGVQIPTRLYRPTKDDSKNQPKLLPLYISFHGGGYHLGNLETEDPHCRQIALKTGFMVLNVDYRHTPDWTFPAPVEDSWSAFQWATRNASQYHFNSQQIFVGGVSAGANLAISVALEALGDDTVPNARGLILGTPSTVHPAHFPVELLKGRPSSLDLLADAPFINMQKLRGFMDLYNPIPTHPTCSPLLRPCQEFVGLCPVSFHIAGLDPLRDEGHLMEEKMREVGVETTLHIYAGVPHAFMSLPALPSAERWRHAIQNDLKGWVGCS